MKETEVTGDIAEPPIAIDEIEDPPVEQLKESDAKPSSVKTRDNESPEPEPTEDSMERRRRQGSRSRVSSRRGNRRAGTMRSRNKKANGGRDRGFYNFLADYKKKTVMPDNPNRDETRRVTRQASKRWRELTDTEKEKFKKMPPLKMSKSRETHKHDFRSEGQSFARNDNDHMDSQDNMNARGQKRKPNSKTNEHNKRRRQ